MYKSQQQVISLSPMQHWFAPGFVNYKQGCTRLAAASDKVYQLFAYCRWFSPGTRLLPPLKPIAMQMEHIFVNKLLQLWFCFVPFLYIIWLLLESKASSYSGRTLVRCFMKTHQMYCALRVAEVTLISTHNQKIGKPNNLKFWEQ
jgi:hypothetical protein